MGKKSSNKGDSSDESTPKVQSAFLAVDRKVTDKTFLILFIAFLVGGFIVLGKAVSLGNPRRLLNGYDQEGNICGFDNSADDSSKRNLEDYGSLYFADFTNLDVEICVEECPSIGVLDLADFDATDLAANTVAANFQCDYATDDETADSTGLYVAFSAANVAADRCWPIYSTTSLLNRCVPFSDNTSGSLEGVSDAVDASSIGRQAWADVENTIGPLIGFFFLALVVGFLWIYLMRTLAAPMVWVAIFGILILLAVTCYSLLSAAKEAEDDYDDAVELGDSTATKTAHRALYAFGYVAAAGIVIYASLILFLRKRIKLAIEVMKHAGRAVTAVPTTILFPLVLALALFGYFVIWVVVMLYLYTAGEETTDNADNFTGFQQSTSVRNLQIFQVFQLLWITAFLNGLGITVLAGAFAAFFFKREGETLVSPLKTSLGRILRFHLGSIALGSLILAVIQFIRLVLNYMQKKAEESKNTVLLRILKALDYYVRCIEGVVKTVSRNAYILVAIHGSSFCASARRASSLIVKNILRFAVLNSIGDFVLFMGRLCVTLLVTLISVWVFRMDDDLNHYAVPVALVFVVAYFVSKLMFSVYESAVDTILLCFLEDVEENDGESRPYFMPEDMRRMLTSSESKSARKRAEAAEEADSSGKADSADDAAEMKGEE